jgi:hypothetical protein
LFGRLKKLITFAAAKTKASSLKLLGKGIKSGKDRSRQMIWSAIKYCRFKKSGSKKNLKKHLKSFGKK